MIHPLEQDVLVIFCFDRWDLKNYQVVQGTLSNCNAIFRKKLHSNLLLKYLIEGGGVMANLRWHQVDFSIARISKLKINIDSPPIRKTAFKVFEEAFSSNIEPVYIFSKDSLNIIFVFDKWFSLHSDESCETDYTCYALIFHIHVRINISRPRNRICKYKF